MEVAWRERAAGHQGEKEGLGFVLKESVYKLVKDEAKLCGKICKWLGIYSATCVGIAKSHPQLMECTKTHPNIFKSSE